MNSYPFKNFFLTSDSHLNTVVSERLLTNKMASLTVITPILSTFSAFASHHNSIPDVLANIYKTEAGRFRGLDTGVFSPRRI